MANLLEIKQHPFSLYFHQRQLFAYYDHYLMYFDLKKFMQTDQKNELWEMEEISIKNINDCDNEVFSLGRMKRYLATKQNHVKGFLFRNRITTKPCGFLWIMYPEENEFQYRVRKVDAFIFDVYVSPDCRGAGLCGYMFQLLFEFLIDISKYTVALGVRTDNPSAIRAYQKAGGEIKTRRRFIQLVHRYNIPYYTV